MSNDIIVQVECMEHAYAGGVRVDYCGLQFEITRGQRVAVLGPNGSGKSTLLKHILGMLRPTSGTIRVFGEDPGRNYKKIRARIGAVMQYVDEQMIGPTVFDDIAFAPLNYGFSYTETKELVEAIMKSLDISHLRDRLPHYLSGGERKKVALAGALVFNPELLILDEPLEGVDHASSLEISEYLYQLHRDTGMTMISTVHDMNLVAKLADVGYVIKDGGRVELHSSVEELFFQHDLSKYNLAPPVVAEIITRLNAAGYELSPTLDVNILVKQLINKGPSLHAEL